MGLQNEAVVDGVHESTNAQGVGENESSDKAKVFSQFTYTMYPDGNWENKQTFTDGTVDYQHSGHLNGHPVHGDIKHHEQVWNIRTSHWDDRVLQYY